MVPNPATEFAIGIQQARHSSAHMNHLWKGSSFRNAVRSGASDAVPHKAELPDGMRYGVNNEKSLVYLL